MGPLFDFLLMFCSDSGSTGFLMVSDFLLMFRLAVVLHLLRLRVNKLHHRHVLLGHLQQRRDGNLLLWPSSAAAAAAPPARVACPTPTDTSGHVGPFLLLRK